jgi:hypothetical protein
MSCSNTGRRRRHAYCEKPAAASCQLIINLGGRGGRSTDRLPSCDETVGPITLIRPPVVKRENLSVRGSRGVPAYERPGGRARETGADLISRAVSDTGVCTKHLLRLDRAAEHFWVTRAEDVRPPRPRNSSVPACRPTQCERALVRDQSQLARGSGEGQPTALGANVGHDSRAGTESNQRKGLRGPQSITGRDARARSGPHRGVVHRGGLGPIGGPVRRQAHPCLSSGVSWRGSRPSRPRR